MIGVHYWHMFATSLLKMGYKHIIKPLLFRCDPEVIHDVFTQIGHMFGAHAVFRTAARVLFSYHHPSLEQTLFGIRFSNPLGLAAGFDKNAALIPIMHAVGFGFSEVGSITGEPCVGNPKPRLWRLPKTQAIMVWYGLKNDGARIIAQRLSTQHFPMPVGTSVARTNDASTVDMEAGIMDYVKAFQSFAEIGVYTTVNISCPNTCGGEPFTSPERLDRLLAALDAVPTPKPIFIKCPADITFEAIDALLTTALRHRVHGVVLSNLTKDYHAPAVDQSELTSSMRGGLSGAPTRERSCALIAHVYRTFGHRLIIIGVGGVFTGQDAYRNIRAGASLVQLATGMIFQGPQSIGVINRELVNLLQQDGYTNIFQAIGADHPEISRNLAGVSI